MRFYNRKCVVLCRRHIYYCLIISFVVCFVTYTEVISYNLNVNNWFLLPCANPDNCLRILLVADPQITGHESLDYLKSLAQHDGDNFIKKTYLHALNFVKPNVIVYLGDLMDEGSTATDEEYYSYLKRFNYLFPEERGLQQIWLPGDNDVGGEGRDRVTPTKLRRFREAFPQNDIIKHGKTVFVKVNQMTHNIPKIEEKREFYNTSQVYVVLSHMPLMFMPTLFAEKVFTKVQPQVIFAAHQHKAMIVSTDGLLRQDRQILTQTRYDIKTHQLTLGATDMYEIMVPTCSYRMGTSEIGYGYAVLENDNLQYTVLWSPSRFYQFWNYILMVLLVLISYLFVKFYQ